MHNLIKWNRHTVNANLGTCSFRIAKKVLKLGDVYKENEKLILKIVLTRLLSNKNTIYFRIYFLIFKQFTKLMTKKYR